MINANVVREGYDKWIEEHDDSFDEDIAFTAYQEGYLQALRNLYKITAQMHDVILLAPLPGQFKGKE
jgi:hypothetical protein